MDRLYKLSLSPIRRVFPYFGLGLLQTPAADAGRRCISGKKEDMCPKLYYKCTNAFALYLTVTFQCLKEGKTQDKTASNAYATRIKKLADGMCMTVTDLFATVDDIPVDLAMNVLDDLGETIRSCPPSLRRAD